MARPAQGRRSSHRQHGHHQRRDARRQNESRSASRTGPLASKDFVSIGVDLGTPNLVLIAVVALVFAYIYSRFSISEVFEPEVNASKIFGAYNGIPADPSLRLPVFNLHPPPHHGGGILSIFWPFVLMWNIFRTIVNIFLFPIYATVYILRLMVFTITLPLRVLFAIFATAFGVVNGVVQAVMTVLRVCVFIVFAPYWIAKSLIETAFAVFLFVAVVKVAAMYVGAN